MAYIDTELAKLGQGGSASAHPPNGETVRAFSPNGTLIDAGLNRQPAALGKLHEIDLGPDARLRNIARTEAAKRRLERGEAEAEEPLGKRQLRRNGRSYRGRKRRTSVDTRRDKLVEEVMRESRRKIPLAPPPSLIKRPIPINPINSRDLRRAGARPYFQ